MPPMEMPARQYCKNAVDVMNIPPDIRFFLKPTWKEPKMNQKLFRIFPSRFATEYPRLLEKAAGEYPAAKFLKRLRKILFYK